ncbi:Ileal sodium/bile acid cotransporter, putative [Theobroma cacao]|uniref:Ileal sodium/bile acid cotransporter, putative n=1 Tax=Theobroma cacao TaxID=3641 RepID=A0A061EGV0_THECC|nr:Ileal sodium/bile acid cotransporter, putative [Theobroma cacao]
MPPYSNLSSPTGLPFSLLSTIKEVFHRVVRILSQFRPCSDANSLILPITRSSSLPTSRAITRMRFYTASYQWRSQALDCIPLSINSLEIEMQSYQPRPPVSLGKTILSLSFQIVVALALSSSMGQTHHVLPIDIVKISMIMAFAASFSGIFLRSSYPKMANIIENIGSLIAAVGFFIMTSIFLPGNLYWVTWLACAFSLLAFFSSLGKS